MRRKKKEGLNYRKKDYLQVERAEVDFRTQYSVGLVLPATPSDFEKLQEAERKITMLRISDLIDIPIEGNFDLKHFKEIHKYIFQDIYDWAGDDK